ncbi:MAG: carboxylating nicotinate-nucleotide diphosphorylase [Bacteroidia bacterium]|nr:carboxylating nicotinate-nucleotide diphosphorylase [Bacteroidia bacterium]
MQFSAQSPEVSFLIEHALREDIGTGDHTTRATLPTDRRAQMQALIKADGVVAGLAVAQAVVLALDPSAELVFHTTDGARVARGTVAFTITGSTHRLLMAERLLLNLMQRMSGIATQTRSVVDLLAGTATRVLDTRKTAPLLRYIDKWAVQLGGGVNHRIGLYDAILIKDNHIDFAGGFLPALTAADGYRKAQGLDLPIIVECRTLLDVETACNFPGLERLLLDNMPPDTLRRAVALARGTYPTEASGGITPANVRAIAETGVDFVSMGSLTHTVAALDISLKALA